MCSGVHNIIKCHSKWLPYRTKIDRQGRGGVRTAGQVCIVELGLGWTRLCNCIFTTDTLELDQESALDFLSEKSRYRRNIWMENNHLSQHYVQRGRRRCWISEHLSGVRLHLGHSWKYYHFWVVMSSARQQLARGWHGKGWVFCPPTFSPVLGVGQVDHRAVRDGAGTLSVTVWCRALLRPSIGPDPRLEMQTNHPQSFHNHGEGP